MLMDSSNLTHPTGLSTYLARKRTAMMRAAEHRPEGSAWRERIQVQATADDATGVRKLQIREWRLFSTGGADIGDFALGPMSPEYFCSSLSSCLVQIIMILAAQREQVLERIQVKFEADINDARFFGIATSDPLGLFNLQATVTVDAPTLGAQAKRDLVADAEARCGLLLVLREPQTVRLVIEEPAAPAASSGLAGLPEYLVRKQAAMAATAARRPDGNAWRERLTATSTAADASGVRRVQIRDWHLLHNGTPDIGDFGLGPMPTEVFCASLASCLTHIILILAAERGLALESVRTQVAADLNDAAYFGVATDDPFGPFNLKVTVAVDALAMSPEARRALIHDAEERCEIVSALRTVTTIRVVVTD